MKFEGRYVPEVKFWGEVQSDKPDDGGEIPCEEIFELLHKAIDYGAKGLTFTVTTSTARFMLQISSLDEKSWRENKANMIWEAEEGEEQ